MLTIIRGALGDPRGAGVKRAKLGLTVPWHFAFVWCCIDLAILTELPW